jgi:LysM repeat protein
MDETDAYTTNLYRPFSNLPPLGKLQQFLHVVFYIVLSYDNSKGTFKYSYTRGGIMSLKTIAQVIILTMLLATSFGMPGNAQACASCGDSDFALSGDVPGSTLNLSGYNVYIVQRGDTFSGIAVRFGVSVNELWAANPQIWDINRIYPGQVIYIPASSRPVIVPNPEETLVARSTDGVLPGTPSVDIKLLNAANSEVYVSLQGVTKNGVSVINEYPVSGAMKAKVPAGWYVYVAWVGGTKFSGQFNLRASSHKTMTFYINKVVVE